MDTTIPLLEIFLIKVVFLTENRNYMRVCGGMTT
nr:MAG TPA: hypothetical protein [Caudoviricetes sp.]